MEVKELYGFTLLLILVGMVIGVGVLTLDKFSTSVYSDSTGTQNDLVIFTNGSTSTTASTITFSSLTVVNSTDGTAITVACDSTAKWGCSAITLVSPASANGSAVNLSYTYGIDSAATDALQASRGEIGTIASTWLGLIVTIAILSIILLLVIRSFGGRT